MSSKYQQASDARYTGKSQMGMSIPTDIEETRESCQQWEIAMCISIRADHAPETLLTEEEGVLMCPVCGYKLNWEVEK
jgi:hypothetical protein